MQTQDFFNILPGHWHYIRSITNYKDLSLSGDGTGNCEFVSVCDNDLLYLESGTFNTKDGCQLKTFNSYFYVFNGVSNNLEKYFVAGQNTKGDLFYILSDNNTASHLCGNDTYKASYKVLSESAFVITYSVKGPRKDYILSTTFTR